MQLLIASLCTLLLGLLLTLAVRAVAHALGAVAAPRRDRWHRRPTALLGGVAIYLTFVAGSLTFAPHVPGVRLILLGGTLLFLSGLADDFLHLKPYVKLVVQLVVAGVVVYFGRRLPWTHYEAVNILITMLWLVGITNAVNLLDNMDGLAGGVTVIACAFLTATFLLNGQVAQAMLPAVLGGAVLAFLCFNAPPATIFMGDCGSLLLGFVLSAMALLSDYDRTRNLGAVLCTPVLILLIPIFDTCVVTATRKLAGRPISRGGRDHTSHRLVALGLSERRAVWLLYALAAGAGTLALLVRELRLEVLLWFIPSTGLVLLGLGIYLGRVRVYEAQEPPAGNTIITALAYFPYKRRVLEILLDVTLTALAYYGAYLLRGDGGVTPEQMQLFLRTLPLVIGAQLSVLLLCGVYRGLWHYAGPHDLLKIAKAVLAGSVANVLIVFALAGKQSPPLALFVLYALLLCVFVSASRWSFRLLRALLIGPAPESAAAQPALIYGAGKRGALLLRELLNNSAHNYVPVGFLDDNLRKAGKRLQGYRIYNSGELPELIDRYGVCEVLVSTSQIPESKLAHLRWLGLGVSYLCIRIERELDLAAPKPVYETELRAAELKEA